MKGLTWKKVMSIVLALALIVSVANFGTRVSATNQEAKVNATETDTKTNPITNPTVAYTVDVTLGSQDGETTGAKTDIVLAIDVSGSMVGDPLTNAKAAATQFVKSLIGTDENGNVAITKQFVRIAVVTYGDTAVASDFSNDYNTLANYISNISTTTNVGTNYDAGLEEVKDLFDDTEDGTKKVLVFISDGEPTYANGIWTEVDRKDIPRDIDKEGPGRISLKGIASIQSGYVYYEVGENLYRRAISYESLGDGVYSYWFANGSKWEKATISDSSTTLIGHGFSYTSIVGKAATNEATALKAPGSDVKIYSILINDDGVDAKGVLSDMANNGFTQTTDDALAGTLAEIGAEITEGIDNIYPGYAAYIEATLSGYVVATDATKAVVNVNEDGTSFIWSIGDLSGDKTSDPIPFEVNEEAVVNAVKNKVLTFAENEEGKKVVTVPITATATLYYKAKPTDTDFQPMPVELSQTLQYVLDEDIFENTIRYELEVETDNGYAYEPVLDADEEAVIDTVYSLTAKKEVLDVADYKTVSELSDDTRYVGTAKVVADEEEVADWVVRYDLGKVTSTVKYYVYDYATKEYKYQGENYDQQYTRTVNDDSVTAAYVEENKLPVTTFVTGDIDVNGYDVKVEAAKDTANEFGVYYKEKLRDWNVIVKVGDDTVVDTTENPIQKRWHDALTEQEVYVEYIQDKNVESYNTDDVKYSKDDYLESPTCVLDEKTFTWTITYVRKGTTPWKIVYVVDGTSVKTDSFTKNNDVTAEAILKERKAAFADVVKVGEAKDYDEAEPVFTEETNEDVVTKVITISYTVKKQDWKVTYVVGDYKYVDDNTYAQRSVLNPLTEAELQKSLIAVSKLPDGGFADDDYELKSVKKSGDFEFTVTYAEKITEDPIVDPIIDPIVDPVITKMPVPSFTPDAPTPTEPTPTETPAEPTPTEEPIVIEETETPEGDVDLDEVETPQAAPEEEELDVEPIDTPQGDLPQTGVASSAVFFGIGAACVLFGGVVVLKNRRREEM